MDVLFTRDWVISGKPGGFHIDAEDMLVDNMAPKIFMDSFKVNDVEISKEIKAVDGNEEANSISEPTAAALLTNFHIEPLPTGGTYCMQLAVVFDSDIESDLRNELSQIKSKNIEDPKITLGSFNENQEWKKDDKWGLVLNLSDYEFVPGDSFEYSIAASDSLGNSPKGKGLYYITLEDLKCEDHTDFEVGSERSTDQGKKLTT